MEKGKKTFEQSIARLDEIVSGLERGDVPLEDALKWFEEGTALAKHCGALLKNAEQKVLKLAKTSEGAVEAVPFEEKDAE